MCIIASHPRAQQACKNAQQALLLMGVQALLRPNLQTFKKELILSKKTIIRMWRGEVSLDKADAYEALMQRIAAPDYRSVEGLLAFYFTRRDLDDKAEFLLITHWQSLTAIKNFAGDNPLKAKYYPQDQAYLLAFPEQVEHFKVFGFEV
jgi:heme-degrading monooxygenase HmoA